MKSCILYILIYCLTLSLSAQQLERSVIGSAGRNVQTSNLQLSFTIGELIVTTKRNNLGTLTQGFHQADIACAAAITQVNTSNTTERCKGDNQQFINLTNNGSESDLSSNYTYVITDQEDEIVRTFNEARFDVNLLQAGSYRIYGVFHQDVYSPQAGESIRTAEAEVCKSISSNFIPLTLSLPPTDAEILLPATDTSLCGDPRISLTAVEPVVGSGTWRGSRGVQFSNPFSSNTIATGLLAGNNTISWEVITPGCPASSIDVTIEYTAPSDPAEILTGSVLSVCANDGHRLQAKVSASNQAGRWESRQPGITFTPNDSAFVVTVSDLQPDQNVIYWVLGEQPCQTRDSIIIFNDAVNSVAQINTPPDTSEVHTICTNQVTLQADEPLEGEIGTWRVVGGANLGIEPNPNDTEITLMDIPDNREVEVVWEISKGNCVAEVSPSRTFFNIGGVTAADIITQDTTLCDDQPITLVANTPNTEESAIWSANTDLNFSPDPTTNEIEVSGFAPGLNEIAWTISAPNCPDNQDFIEVFVISQETDLFESDTTLLCDDGQPLTLTPTLANLGMINTFQWTTGETTNSIVVNPVLGENLEVGLSLQTAGGCEISDEILVSRDTLGLTIMGTPICVPNGVVFDADLNAEVEGNRSDLVYSWSTGESGPSINVSDPGLYQVTVTTNAGCNYSEFYEVVIDSFDTEIQPGDTTLDLGNSIVLQAIGGDVYEWNEDPSLSCTECQAPRVTPEQTTTYTVNIFKFNGCTTTESIEIEILTENATCGQVFIPNILTPGNNGFNDTWVIDNLSPLNEVNVYDRWGNEVFRASPYENDWDGDFVERGTYLYILKLNDEQVCRGSLTIIPD